MYIDPYWNRFEIHSQFYTISGLAYLVIGFLSLTVNFMVLFYLIM